MALKYKAIYVNTQLVHFVLNTELYKLLNALTYLNQYHTKDELSLHMP